MALEYGEPWHDGTERRELDIADPETTTLIQTLRAHNRRLELRQTVADDAHVERAAAYLARMPRSAYSGYTDNIRDALTALAATVEES